jgi:PAS domain S-box-containing protein
LSENILAIGTGISPKCHICLATVSESSPWIPAYFMAAAATTYEHCQPSGTSAKTRLAIVHLPRSQEMPISDDIVLQGPVYTENKAMAERAITEPEASKYVQRLEQQWMIVDATLSSIADFAYTFDSAGRFVYVNRPLLDLWGKTLEQVVGKNFFDLQYPDETAAQLQRQIQEVFATGNRITDETPYTSPTGSVGYYEYIFSPIIGAAGTIDFVAGTTRDITVRKDSERHLKQMEARYRGLLEAAPDAMVVVDEAGAIVLLNVQAEKQFGYSRDALVGKKVKSIIPEGFAERLIADGTRTAADALAQQIGTGIELFGLRRDGTEFPIEIMLSPLESPDGILVTAAIRDITVRKNAERHLAQMEARYRGLLEAAPDGMVVVNHDGEIVLLNAQAEKQFGYSRDELVGKKVKSIIPEGFAERLIADGARTAVEALEQQIGTGI